MTIIEFYKLKRENRIKEDRKKVIKSGGHCYDGMGWYLCDFWYSDKDIDKCLMFGDCVKYKSESLYICNNIYSYDYNDKA